MQHARPRIAELKPLTIRDVILVALVFVLGTGLIFALARLGDEEHAAKYACDVLMRLAPHYEEDEGLKGAMDSALKSGQLAPNTRRVGFDEAVGACDNKSREAERVLISTDEKAPF